MNKPCDHCGKPVLKKRDSRWLHVYCSRACYKGHHQSEKFIHERFWSGVHKTDGCWNFMRRAKPEGYCFFSYGPEEKPVQWYVHRYSWVLHFGPIPDGLDVAHRCDNRRCVRPDHLFLATHEENMADMKAKRRHLYGERSYHAKLTEAQVIELRQRFAGRDVKELELKDLAAQYGVGAGSLYNAITGVTWRHIPLDAASKSP